MVSNDQAARTLHVFAFVTFLILSASALIRQITILNSPPRIARAPAASTLNERDCFMRSGDQAPVTEPHAGLSIVARSRDIVPKRRRIERLPSGYSVRELRSDSAGNYWFVITALEVA